MKFTGTFVATASGSLAGITASRGKGGMYLRARAVPTISTSAPAINAKARLASASASWAGLTDEQRASWTRWGTIKPTTNPLGMQKILTGIAAYNSIFTRMDLAGDTPLTVPPIGSDPDALATATATFSLAGPPSFVFTPTPLGATQHLWLEAALVDSPGINYIEDVKRFIYVSAAALASPVAYQALVEAVLGPFTIGQKVILLPRVYDDTTGLLSQPRRVEGVITA